ncbi:hypothetical protein J7T55_004318 [Diaporthe amygdali]|uniref:uncharacterized protein n=1 Tax=Phomopsis amygdali TaxID=1214568 RepID=UPI0022FDF0BB|nr:uncharacterized protein J7T55_004318 [Diaporthe amygdali]KAJ0109769.1 hypothetical protein J7T55_004318 [Diaporthe amygdali]
MPPPPPQPPPAGPPAQTLEEHVEEQWNALPPLNDDSSSVASDAPDPEDDYSPDDNMHKWQSFHAVPMLPGRQPMRSQDEVTHEMADNLRDLISRPKAIHYNGSGMSTVVTIPDVKQLVKAAFARGWITGKPHQMCGKGYVQPTIDDVAAQVGFLNQNITATSSNATSGKTTSSNATSGKTTLGKTTSDKATPGTKGKKKAFRHPAVASKVKKMALSKAKAANSSARKALRPVYLGCSESMDGGAAMFTYYDQHHKVLPRTAQKFVTLPAAHESLATAKGMAMQLHDQFKMSRVREYNLRAAIYLARNRLTHWANGNDVASRPEREDKDLFVEYILMRHLEYPEQAVMNIYKQVMVPALWEDMGKLF